MLKLAAPSDDFVGWVAKHLGHVANPFDRPWYRVVAPVTDATKCLVAPCPCGKHDVVYLQPYECDAPGYRAFVGQCHWQPVDSKQECGKILWALAKVSDG